MTFLEFLFRNNVFSTYENNYKRTQTFGLLNYLVKR